MFVIPIIQLFKDHLFHIIRKFLIEDYKSHLEHLFEEKDKVLVAYKNAEDSGTKMYMAFSIKYKICSLIFT